MPERPQIDLEAVDAQCLSSRILEYLASAHKSPVGEIVEFLRDSGRERDAIAVARAAMLTPAADLHEYLQDDTKGLDEFADRMIRELNGDDQVEPNSEAKAKKPRAPKKKSKRKASSKPPIAVRYEGPEELAEQILYVLGSPGGEHGLQNSDLLHETGTTKGKLRTALTKLQEQGKVVLVGQRKSARYFLSELAPGKDND